VTVIEHFHVWQVNQISLPLIINATDDSATTLEITTNKAAVMRSPMQWRSNAIYRPWIFARNAAPPLTPS